MSIFERPHFDGRRCAPGRRCDECRVDLVLAACAGPVREALRAHRGHLELVAALRCVARATRAAERAGDAPGLALCRYFAALSGRRMADAEGLLDAAEASALGAGLAGEGAPRGRVSSG